MSAEVSAAVGFTVAGTVCCVATPLAIATASRTDFYDCPRGYRQHAQPTPLLGGAAIASGVLVSAVAIGSVTGKLLVLLVCAIALWLLGTLDDRFVVPPKWRVLAAAAAAVALYVSSLGWDTVAGGGANLLLTVFWVVGLVNAFNLMDNLDGACSTVAAVSAGGIGVLALIKGTAPIAGLAFSLCAACVAFLRWNLARPAKVFLGDGGSMTVGFLLAALAMAATRQSEAGNAGVLVGALLVGLPILDTALVILSRTRRGVTIVTGGRDHLTHRILLAVRTPRSVAVALALTQGILCALAILGYELGTIALALFAVGAFLCGVAAIFVLDTARWRPPGIAFGPRVEVERQPSGAPSISVDSG